MKIAQVAPLIESVPPVCYGGIERVVSYLTEELVRLGHDVTLFASGDSTTSAELVASIPRAVRLSGMAEVDPTACNILQLEHVRQRAGDFDIIHFHDNFMSYPLVRAGIGSHVLCTLHGRLDLPMMQSLSDEFAEVPLVSISNSQRSNMPGANWMGTVYHGLPDTVCEFNAHPTGDYVAFLGRISEQKRPDRAVEIARRANVKLRIAAKVDAVDERYFCETIEPLLGDSRVEFIGEINEQLKSEFLGNARALLFPIDYAEAFGLVLIEAMSCGTPVIAWRRASVPELVDNGITGFTVDSLDDAVHALSRIPMLDRSLVRARFKERFTVERMARDYLRIYDALIRGELRHSAVA